MKEQIENDLICASIFSFQYSAKIHFLPNCSVDMI